MRIYAIDILEECSEGWLEWANVRLFLSQQARDEAFDLLPFPVGRGGEKCGCLHLDGEHSQEREICYRKEEYETED